MELAKKRKSTRSFKEDEISLENINTLLDTAINAPSGGNCQPWHFFVVKDNKTKNELSTAAGQSFIANAPINIVVCIDYKRTVARYGERGKNLYSIQDTAAAIQNLLLCAAELDLATCWCGAFNEKTVSAILDLEPDKRPVAIIPVGYAAGTSGKTGRLPIEEVSTFIGFDD